MITFRHDEVKSGAWRCVGLALLHERKTGLQGVLGECERLQNFVKRKARQWPVSAKPESTPHAINPRRDNP